VVIPLSLMYLRSLLITLAEVDKIALGVGISVGYACHSRRHDYIAAPESAILGGRFWYIPFMAYVILQTCGSPTTLADGGLLYPSIPKHLLSLPYSAGWCR
jgi:hypothetical protein